jgi:hypothetical protein
MVQTAIKPTEPDTKPFVVLRPICMAGERVEIGETVELTRTQGTELATATKVAPAGSPAADAAIKQAKEAKATSARHAKEAKATAVKPTADVPAGGDAAQPAGQAEADKSA